LLAQLPGLQARSIGALERMHDRVANPTGAVKSTAVIASETMILLNIELLISQVRPHVEESVQPLAALFMRILSRLLVFICISPSILRGRRPQLSQEIENYEN
jgi:hypothetical protein